MQNVAAQSRMLSFSTWPTCPHQQATVHVIGQGARVVAPGAGITSLGNASGVETFRLEWTTVRLQSSVSMELPPTAELMEARGEVACQHAASGVRAGLDAQAHEIFDAASLGYGDVLSTAASLASMTDDDNGTVLWTVNSSSLGPAVAENQSVALQWWIEGASSSFGSTVPYSCLLYTSPSPRD